MGELYDHVNAKDAVPRILEAFELHAQGYSHLVLRTFETKIESEWRNAGWSLCACVPGEPTPTDAVEYQDTRMRCEARPVAEFRNLIDGAWLHQQVAGTPSLDLSHASVRWMVVSLNNRMGRRPGLQWDVHPQTGNMFSWSRRLVGFTQPFQQSPITAYGAWFNMPDLRNSGDGRAGMVTIYLPETRAWFSEISRTQDGLQVHVERRSAYSTPLRLKGRAGPLDFEEPFDVAVDGESVDLPLPVGTTSLEILLVAEDDSVLSWHSETAQFVNGEHRVLVAEALGGAAAEVEKLIRTGECDTIEFKSFIDPKTDKYDDILRVICSFANTRGGTLLIGVEDDASITGVEGGVRRWAREPIDYAIRRYEKLLVKRIGERIDPRPVIQFTSVELMEHKVIVVHVDPAVRKPLTLDGPIWLRFAGTTRRALGTEIQTMFSAAAEEGDPRDPTWT